ncbi:MAG: hypothetical protein LUF92_15140 [Clostridiales bacterium]|nr:hypothetical protein [Clostridiales bacterium]
MGISSPSKKFKTDVGEQLSKGMAFGIKDTSNLASDEAEKMSTKVYSKATSWLKKYKKSHDVSRADEKYYWKQVVKHCEEGTTAYSKAVAKLLTASVSKTTTPANCQTLS